MFRNGKGATGEDFKLGKGSGNHIGFISNVLKSGCFEVGNYQF